MIENDEQRIDEYEALLGFISWTASDLHRDYIELVAVKGYTLDEAHEELDQC